MVFKWFFQPIQITPAKLLLATVILAIVFAIVQVGLYFHFYLNILEKAVPRLQ